MKQQESNQFDKGLLLDTNPINIDNHTLTGALNATYITRNGNEAILQNDMGNTKVESAYLPSGYVPVGMKEHGGIVYVASYNPLTEESLIGSFPSPERNIDSDELGTPECKIESSDFLDGTKYIIKNAYYKIALINDDLHSGDKFQIIFDDSSDKSGILENIYNNIIELKAIIVGDNGENIDITNKCTTYQYNYNEKLINSIAYFENTTYTLNDILVYDSISNTKISIKKGSSIPNNWKDNVFNVIGNEKGKLYIGAQLIVPEFIDPGININVTPSGNYIIKFNPQGYIFDSEGNWISLNNNGYTYKYELKGNGKAWNGTTGSYELNINNSNEIVDRTNGTAHYINNPLNFVNGEYIFSYSIKIKYDYNGTEYIVDELECKDTLELSKVATGIVEINNFRYFNTFKRNTNDNGISWYTDFYYNIKPYFDNTMTIDSFDLLVLDSSEILNDSNKTLSLYVIDHNLTKEISFPNIPQTIGSYTQRISNNNPNLNSGNAYVCMLRIKVNTWSSYQYSKPYIYIVTSATNKYYFEYPNNEMLPIDSSTINLPVDINYELESSENKQLPEDVGSGSTSFIEKIEGNPKPTEFTYDTTRTQRKTYKVKSNYEFVDKLSNIGGLINLSCDTRVDITNITNTLINYQTQGTYTDDDIKNATNFVTITPTHNHSEHSGSDKSDECKFELECVSHSKFYGTVAKNTSGTSNPSDEEEFTQTLENTTALTPYIFPLKGSTNDGTSYDIFNTQLFGCDFIQSPSGDDKKFPTKWVTMNFYGQGGIWNIGTSKANVRLAFTNVSGNYLGSGGNIDNDLNGIGDFELPGVDETNSTGTYTVADYNTKSVNWKAFCSALTNYLKTKVNIFPPFLVWQPCRQNGSWNGMAGTCATSQGTYRPLAIYSSNVDGDTNYWWNAAAKQYSYLLMRDLYGDNWYLVIDPTRLNNRWGNLSATTGALGIQGYNIISQGSAINFAHDYFDNIYVPRNGLTVTYKYYKCSTSSSDYIYSEPYTINAKIKIVTTIKVSPDDKLNTKTFLSGEKLKFPKFTIENSNSDTYIIEDYITSEFESPDLSEMNADFLSSNVNTKFSGIAKLLQDDNTEKVISSGYYYNAGGNLIRESLKMGEPYVKIGNDLYRCNEYLKDHLNNESKYYIAKALSNKSMKFITGTSGNPEIVITTGINHYSNIKDSEAYKDRPLELHEIFHKGRKPHGDNRDLQIVYGYPNASTWQTSETKDGSGCFNRRAQPWKNWTSYFPMYFGRTTYREASINENGGYAGSSPRYYSDGQFGATETCNSATYIFNVILNVFALNLG